MTPIGRTMLPRHVHEAAAAAERRVLTVDGCPLAYTLRLPAGLPSPTMRPCFSMMTRSHKRSTSLILCEASKMVAPLARR